MDKPGFTGAQRWALGLAGAGSFMAALDAMVVSTALETLRHDLGASVAALEWTVNAYGLSFAALLMTGAALGDRLGRRRMYIAGLLLFAAASAACALAPDTAWLVAARALQGLGAALIMPIGTMAMPAAQSAVLGAVEPADIGKASGLFNTLRQLGGVLGVALAVAVFVHAGGYGNAHDFSNGFAAALMAMAMVSLAGAAMGLRLRGRPAPAPAVSGAAGAKA